MPTNSPMSGPTSSPAPSDTRTVHMIVLFLGANGTIGLLGLLLLSYLSKEPNAALYALVGSVFGSLATLLAQTRSSAQRASDGQPTTIQTETADVEAGTANLTVLPGKGDGKGETDS